MHVIAIHDISDPERFFDAAATTPIPDGMTLHSVLPSDDGSRAVCVWEADSLDAVQGLVDGTVGDVSKNQFFEVDAGNARGLPS
jgi:hypothetical protein